jgi:hypothetical protein
MYIYEFWCSQAASWARYYEAAEYGSCWPLLFKSIGEGSKQLNYGKAYSGLYVFEGHVVP